MPEKRIFTVSELTRYVRVILEDSFPEIWVEGEVSNYTFHTSGHIYFSLKDKNAVLRCAMFRSANVRLKFELKDGMKVISFGRLSVYEARGEYQLIVKEIEPRGIGARQLQFQQLKEKLQKEGLFDDAHKVPIPHLPTRIGVVTSPTGAAIRDILKIVRRRFSNIEVILNPVKVQGEGASKEIAGAIRQLNYLNSRLKIDTVIVGRGGGSLEDLWAFNEEAVARAIYESEIPVISAVGHEIDYTISDFVADFRAATPSAAAELVIPKKEDLVNAISAQLSRLKNAIVSELDTLSQRLKMLRESYVLRQPINLILQYQQRLDDLQRDLAIRMERLAKAKDESFNLLLAKLETLSPLAILSRGYSITMRFPEKVIIGDSNELKKDDRVKTRLGRGTFISRVEEVEE